MPPEPKPRHLPGLKGRRVAITAGYGEIGLAIAHALRRQGARLADVSAQTQVGEFVAEIQTTMSGLDALVNNARIAGPTESIEEIAPSGW